MIAKTLLSYLGYFGAGGVAGWMLENAFSPKTEPRYSSVFGGHKVPFLPIYGAGSVLVRALAPAIQAQPLLARTALYGASLTALEWGSCRVERDVFKKRSWGYGKNGACIDLPHALTWAALGLVMEQAVVLPLARQGVNKP